MKLSSRGPIRFSNFKLENDSSISHIFSSDLTMQIHFSFSDNKKSGNVLRKHKYSYKISSLSNDLFIHSNLFLMMVPGQIWNRILKSLLSCKIFKFSQLSFSFFIIHYGLCWPHWINLLIIIGIILILTFIYLD